MKIINQSRKIIGIFGEPLLPGDSRLLPEGYQTHPVIQDYLEKGILSDAKQSVIRKEICDLERARIAEEAVAQYKKQQEEAAEIASVQAEKEVELKAIRTMKKTELFTKAIGMGIIVKDEDTVEQLREKITAAIRE